MQYVARQSYEWLARFWHRPLDAVPVMRGSLNVNSLATQTETEVLLDGIVPAWVNGFRVSEVWVCSSTPSGGAKIRLYDRAVRGSGATLNIPQFYELDAFAGSAPVAYPVAWLLEPADPWEFTIFNSKAGGGAALSLLWGGLAGWYF